MADDNDMPEAHAELDASARRLAALELRASRRTDAAKLPSNDDLLIAVKDTTLRENGIPVVPLNSDRSKDLPAKNVYTFFAGAAFQALSRLGNKGTDDGRSPIKIRILAASRLRTSWFE
ncbi:hypothetical protein ACVWXQ_000018 [Bradyrhizobium sp. S3.14.4]